MAITFEQADEMRQSLGMEYMQRHGDLKKLRDYWQGRWWEQYQGERGGLNSLFQDMFRKSDDTSPDFKVIHNILHEVCLKYQTFLSPLPMIRVYVDPPESRLRREQAVRKERYLYSLWGQRPLSMAQILNRVAWYLPLMGDCFLGAMPDLENNLIRPVLRSPEYAFPVPSYDGANLEAVIFSWETSKTVAAKQFPGYSAADESRSWVKRKISSGNKVRITEYSDGKEFARWVGKTQVSGVEHDYGFNLFDQLSFIQVPDEVWNHGAVEQIVSLNEAENLMRSLVLQSMIDNVFPTLILEDPSKFPEEIDKGAGAIVGVNPGGKAYHLAPPVQAISTQVGFMAEGERAIKQGAGMSDANFGNPKGSIVTGKAINEMESAGAGTNVEMVQGLGIGLGLVSWNEKALCMGRKMFKEETLNLTGVAKASAISDMRFSETITGAKLVGGYRNDVEFLPALDRHEKVVMGLQGLGAGLWSREHVRNTIGIPDSAAMDDEILGERIQDIVVGAIEQELMAAPTPQAAQDVEGRALAYLQGATPVSNGGAAPSGPPAAPPGAPAPPGGSGGGMPIASLAGGGQVAFPAERMPAGAPVPAPPQGQPAGTAPQSGPAPKSPDTVTLQDAVKAFQGLSGFTGRVFLVGEIVQSGETANDIEVALTAAADKQAISDGLPQWAGRFSFHVVPGEPSEPHVEVTPGAAPEQKGQAPDLAALLGG